MSNPPPSVPKSRSRRSSARAALAVGAAAALAAHVALAAAGERWFWIRDPVYADRESLMRKLRQAQPPDTPLVVMQGTSRGGYGFNAKRCSERLSAQCGRPTIAFNFALAGTGPVVQRVHLPRLLADGHRPSLLLIEIVPAGVAVLPDGPLEARFLDGAAFRHDELPILERYEIPSERIRRQWRETYYTPFLGFRFNLLGRFAPVAVPFHLRGSLGRTGDEYGWHRIMEETFTPERFAESRERALREYTDILRDLHPGGAAGRALRDELELALAEGIPVCVLLMPEATWFRDLSSPRVTERFDRWIHELTREAGCPLIDARGWMSDDRFADGHHLLPGGAEAFTDRLADEVILPRICPGKKVTP
jgi:hypothetical protein